MAIGKSCTIKESAHGAIVVRYDGIANTKKKKTRKKFKIFSAFFFIKISNKFLVFYIQNQTLFVLAPVF